MAVDLSDVYAYIVIFAAFFYMLYQLLEFARNKIEKSAPSPLPDDFLRSYGYGYDYVFVFKVYEEDFKSFNEMQQQFTMRNIIERLQNAGLETKQFYSCQRDEVYVKVRAKPEKFRAEASRINYRLLLDPDRLRAKTLLGKKRGGEWIWRPIKITDEFQQTPLSPYQYIYAAYDAEAYRDDLYMKYEYFYNHKHVFRPIDRIELLITVMQAKTGGDTQGAGLNIAKLVQRQVVLAAFPLHDFEELRKLQLKWLNLFSWPWSQPLDDIRNYFGERIALYFLYLQHYVTYLMLPAGLGCIFFIVQKILNVEEYVMMPIFATFMMLYSSIYTARWKRKQTYHAMKWGTIGIEEEEQDSPLFEGIEIASPITGQKFVYFPASKKFQRESYVKSIIVTLICCVIAIVAGIYFFQYWISNPNNAGNLTIFGVNAASLVGSILNSIVIIILNMIYQRIAVILNDYENHRTDTEYEDYLIAKIFSFEVINSFAGLTYVSFIKHFLNIHCLHNTCTGDVAASLSTIFLSTLITRAISDIFVKKLLIELKWRKETSGLPPNTFPGPIEEQYFLPEYPVITGTLTDYAALVIQYGYMTLFLATFPLAPTIAFISSYIRIRIDGWKLCQAYRRPQPRIAEDIGVWEDMILLLSYFSVLYNFGLIFFTGAYFVNMLWEQRWIAFVLAENAMFALKFLIESAIPPESNKVAIQLARQDFLISKVIKNAEDENEELFKISSDRNVSGFRLFDNDDDDWIEEGKEPITAANKSIHGSSGSASRSQRRGSAFSATTLDSKDKSKGGFFGNLFSSKKQDEEEDEPDIEMNQSSSLSMRTPMTMQMKSTFDLLSGKKSSQQEIRYSEPVNSNDDEKLE